MRRSSAIDASSLTIPNGMAVSHNPYWPIFGLRVRTPRLELRLPGDHELVAVARLVEAGIHARDYMPFAVPWTDFRPPELGRWYMQRHWRALARWSPKNWELHFVALEGDRVVGAQDLEAVDFGVLRTVAGGVWVGRDYQGRGLAGEMRHAVLHLAFAGLGAHASRAVTFDDNEAAIAMLRALGYVDNGWDPAARRGAPARSLRWELDRAGWERIRRDDIAIDGLEPCLPLLGAATSTGD
jgi:RimJ/RimL family protein N-acetyltransferase